MKKGILLGCMGLVSAAALWANPMKVSAEYYYWAQTQEEDETIVQSWYQQERPGSVDSIKVEGMPDIQAGDWFIIDCKPDEECAEWLKSLSGDFNIGVTSFVNADIQVGNPDSEEVLTLSTLNAYHGNLTLYGDVNHIRTGVGDTLDIVGNVGTITLGDEQSECGTGTITISRNVETLNWYPKADKGDFLIGFDGSVYIDGTVGKGNIYEYVYDETVGQNVWQHSKVIESCETGVFQIVNGVLSEQVPTTDVEVEEVSYWYRYVCSGTNYWTMQAYNAETNLFAYSKSCSVEDIPDGGKVIVYSTDQTEGPVINADLSYLQIYAEGDSQTRAQVTVKGNVEELSVRSAKKSAWDITIDGNVTRTYFAYFYHPNHNIKVTGTVAYGTAYEDNKYLGSFSCSDMKLIENGNWNSELFMSKGNIAYQTVSKEELEDALGDESIGQEVTVTTATGDVTLVKDAKVEISETSAATLNDLKETDSVKNALLELEKASCVEAEILTAIDIYISTLYRNASNNEVYTGDENYAETAVTQLAEGKALTFTVQVPSSYYEETADYVVVRHHENEDGSTSGTLLETTREGNSLTFSSDKFSSFLIVKMTEETESTPEQLVSAFVERMYTVALGRDAEQGGLDYWTASLLDGENDGAGIAKGFLLSEEFVGMGYDNEAYVKTLYGTFFDRVPAEEEVAYWAGTLQDGATREKVLSGFVNSEEFFTLCSSFGISRGVMYEDGGVINPGIGRFAERLYTKVLERAGEEAGMEYWAIAIANGNCAPEHAAKSFFNSDEYLEKQSTDEEYVKALYRTFMDRECDESGLEFWIGELSNGATRDSVLDGFAYSEEFREIIASFGL